MKSALTGAIKGWESLTLQRIGLTAILSVGLAGCVPTAEPVTPHVGAGPAQAIRLSAGAAELIRYKTTPTRDLFLHVFAPDLRTFPGPRPAIIFFHGGGWVEGDATRFYNQAKHLAERGMVAISADYRLMSVDGTTPRDALSDAISAMRHVKRNATALMIDSRRIAAGGGSAGAQLAAALATAKGFGDPDEDLTISSQPAALVLFNPVIDNGPHGYGYDLVSEYWRAFSPIHNIRPGHPPTVILLGKEDELVPVTTGEAYCDKVRAVGGRCRLHLYQGQPHAFFALSRSPRYYRETLAAMDAFLGELGYLPTGTD